MIFSYLAPSVASILCAIYLLVQINGLSGSSDENMSGKFLYFAYGSNLLAQRIHINNPSAQRAGIGKLKDYQLDFITYSKRWRGASATIVNKTGSHVWGALWQIDNTHMESLDRQEGVENNLYFPLNVELDTPEGKTVIARVYQQTKTPETLENIENLPDDRKPSAVYLGTILKGAEESKLPEEYKEWLHRIPHNGYDGEVDIGLSLNITK
ncbi:unnamed protein product [Brassicogethes aeneus]|uniref:gamma-glutamylcyclotransferase n=1 Tax=Brassicogethes aeneus TaxID=1431903 RepID=A0A9P0B3L6_BRAAE|nr:unnamed protein product [Brassicogethes aeneus]